MKKRRSSSRWPLADQDRMDGWDGIGIGSGHQQLPSISDCIRIRSVCWIPIGCIAFALTSCSAAACRVLSSSIDQSSPACFSLQIMRASTRLLLIINKYIVNGDRQNCTDIMSLLFASWEHRPSIEGLV